MNIRRIKDLKHIDLTEYASDSPMEKYASIVLDPDENEFKVITGLYHDKKDAYEKLTKRGFVVRKTYEQAVYNWITQNAEDDLVAYLMFSTAVSKWRGNNILSEYYVKLLNDVPHLNREKVKGDPNSKGGQHKKQESVLDEDMPQQQYYKPVERDTTDAHKHTLYIYPVGYDGKRDPKYVHSPILLDVELFDTDKPKRRFDDPNFYRTMFKLQKIDRIGGDSYYPAFDIVMDGNENDVTRMSAAKLAASYYTKNKNPEYRWIPDPDRSKRGNLQKTYERARKMLDDAKAQGAEPEEINALQMQLNHFDDIARGEIYDILPHFTRDEYKKYKVLRDKFNELNTWKDIKASDDKMGARAKNIAIQKEIKAEMDKMLSVARKRGAEKNKLAQKNEFEDLRTQQSILDQGIAPSNPIHGGDSAGKFISDINRKRNVDQKLHKLYRKMNLQEPVKVINKDPEKTKLGTSNFNTYLQNKQDRLDNLNKNIANYKDPEKTKADAVKTFNLLLANIDDRFSEKDVEDISLEVFKDYKKEHPEFNSGVELRKFFNENPKMYYNLLNNKAQNWTGKPKETQEEAVEHVNDGASLHFHTAKLNVPNGGSLPTKSPALGMGGTILEDEIEEAFAHYQLNPELFENNKLKPDVRNAMLKVAQYFEEYLDLPFAPIDIYFTGSNANYNYTDQSDIDLHLVYKFEEVGIAQEILEKYLFAAKKVFNTNYNITIKNIDVELGCENINEPLVTTAIYSVLKDKWVQEPKNSEIEIADPDMPYYHKIVDKIEQAINSRDSSSIGKLWKFLTKLRKDSLQKEGEFGEGNALFKKLRNLGYLKRLKDAFYNSTSQELSLESIEDIE